MDTEIKILNEIRLAPKKYLGKAEIERLLLYIDGFNMCEYMHDSQYVSPLLYLSDYISLKYNEHKNICEIVKKHSKCDEDAFWLFFSLVDEYLGLPPYQKCELYYAVHGERFLKTLSEKKEYLDENFSLQKDYIGLTKFICNHFGISETNNWADYILEKSISEREAIYMFEKLCDLYLMKEYDNKNSN